MGYRNSTPINVMFAETKEPPLLTRFKYLTAKYVIKSIAIREHSAISSLEKLDLVATMKHKIEFIRTRLPLYSVFRKYSNYKWSIVRSWCLPEYFHSFSSSCITASVVSPAQLLLESTRAHQKASPYESSGGV